ncbi:extracellular solute-binding protein [Microbacterium sp. 18062]|uniref:extracellular solute-binding protein n=1 Tax=Microbacterium sp. 18062 TaxID=2681410 RepID=UPI001356EE68|nr:extracellular solute-binding protein [Microbacterium sp. 18062]
MRSTRTTALALLASVALLASGCASTPGTAAPGGTADGEYIVDPAAEGITEEQAAYLTELYEAAQDEGSLTIYSGTPDDLVDVFALFEDTFPGLGVNAEGLIGAPLVQALSAEKASGNHVADVLHNPDAQLYVDAAAAGDFGEPYEVRALEVPAALASSADSIIDPEFRFNVPFLGYFGLGTFLPRLEEAGGAPASFADLADPKYAGKVGMGDPTIPGPQQAALLYLLNSGGLAEDDLPGLGSNTVVKGDYGQAVGGLMQGEYAFMFGAPVSAVVKAADAGAPVEFSVFAEDNPLVSHKHVLLAGAPHPNAAKLYLEFLNLVSAQELLAEVGFMPLDESAADPDAPWTSISESGATEIVGYEVIDASRDTYLPLIEQAFKK